MTPFGEDNEYLLHQVKSGESMPMLAERYQTSLDVITAANGFYPGYGLQLDQVIVIMPGKIDSQDVKPFLVILLDQDISISDLSSQYVVIPEKIKEINDLGLGDIIPVGRWLILPRSQIVPTAPPQPTPTPDLSFALTEPFGPNDEYVIHRLNPGETYQILARLYLTSTDVIKAANVIEASLQVDQLLVIVVGQTDPSEIQPFEIWFTDRDIKVEDLAERLDVLAADLTYYNDLTAGEVISRGSWVIYPVNP